MEYVIGRIHSKIWIKVYGVLLTGDKKILEDEADETKEKVVSELKFLNKTAYNGLILAQ